MPRSTQAPLHAVKPALQRMPHAPSHSAPPLVGTGQATSHRPQWDGSLVRFVQVPSHASLPVLQVEVQVPFEHASPAAQRCSHPPQCSGSRPTSTHEEPQSANPRSHTTLHPPFTQVALP